MRNAGPLRLAIQAATSYINPIAPTHRTSWRHAHRAHTPFSCRSHHFHDSERRPAGWKNRPRKGIFLNTAKPGVATANPCERKGGPDRRMPDWRPYPCLLSSRELKQVIAEQLG